MPWIAVDQRGMAVPNAECPEDALWVARDHKVTSQDLEDKTQGDVWTVTHLEFVRQAFVNGGENVVQCWEWIVNSSW